MKIRYVWTRTFSTNEEKYPDMCGWGFYVWMRILFYNDLFLFFSFVFLSFCFVLFFVGFQFSFYVLLCVVIILYFLLLFFVVVVF